MLKVRKGISNTMLSGCVAGSIGCTIVALVLTIISAVFIDNEYLSIDSIKYIVGIIQFIAVYACFIISSACSGKSKVVSGLVAVGVILLLEICMALLFFEGDMIGFFRNMIISAVSVAAAIATVSYKKKPQFRKQKRRNHR